MKREPRDGRSFEHLVGQSPRMEEIYKLIGKVADTDCTVLIQGENGTGKELVARALHDQSSRKRYQFVTVNCSALPDLLLESELFGHKKGGFTGATLDRPGAFELAHRGTLFLDEIHSTSHRLQTQLLNALQARAIRRGGDTKTTPVNVRVIAASNEPLKALAKEGLFREDLYYRLAVIPIDLPPLRERPEDIPLLAERFVERFAARTSTKAKRLEDRAIAQLVRYPWPGNVEELENAVEQACALSEGAVIDALPSYLVEHLGTTDNSEASAWRAGQKLYELVREHEKRYIEMTLRLNQGSREKTAHMLGISIATLYRKLDLKNRSAP
jgi:two-component system response regulator AtoC